MPQTKKQQKKKHIYVSAGEVSGDLLGAELLDKLIKKSKGKVKFSGIGGDNMNKIKGFKRIYDSSPLSVMGFVEALASIRSIVNVFNGSINHILKTKPDVIVTIDTPAFHRKLAQKLKGRNIDIPIIHYVAPQVWKWKPERAKELSSEIDHLLCILPFEPPYFKKHGLKSDFIGHPVIERIKKASKEKFFKKYKKLDDKVILTLLPGSRTNEIKRLIKPFLKAAENISKEIKNMKILIPTVPQLKPLIKKYTNKSKLNPTIITNKEDKFNAFKATHFAIAASGTVSLELGILNVPHLIAYKFNWITARMVKKLLKDPTASLVNILAGEHIIPEIMQDKCTPENLTKIAVAYLKNSALRKTTIIKMNKICDKLYPNPKNKNLMPSEKAAEIILKYVK
jgi:lipid-A-disaccharide synthase